MSGTPRPPLFARRILTLIVPTGDEGEAMVGDLEEEFATIAVPERGVRASRRWYRSQVVRSAGLVLYGRLASSRRMTAVAAAWLTGAAVFFGLVGISVLVLNATQASALAAMAVFLGTVLIAATAAGYVVSRLDDADPIGSVLLSTALCVSVASMFRASPEPETAVWWILWLGLVVVGVSAGSYSARRRSYRPGATGSR